MKKFSYILYFMLIFSSIACQLTAFTDKQYLQELKELKKKHLHKIVFDRHANNNLRNILKDIEIAKNLTPWQQSSCWAILALDVVIITPDTMPRLYTYVDSLCKQHALETPAIFITKDKWFFNAAAFKFLMGSGAIVLGQDLLQEATDKELEAIIAHEIGHIKHNHVNKTLFINVSCLLSSFLVTTLINKDPRKAIPVSLISYLLLPALIIGKKFEKQADEFAYKSTNQGEGLITFFEHLQQKEQKEKTEFDETYIALQNSASQLTDGYLSLLLRYYMAKLSYKIDRAFKWLYHHTPFGPHPSHEERIRLIKEYLTTQQTLGLTKAQ